MKVLFIGDIVGRPGRRAVKTLLPTLKKETQAEVVIANGENLAQGKGFTLETVKEMQEAGIEIFTSGNHVWANKIGVPLLNNPKAKFLRPANYPDSAPGRGYLIYPLYTKNLLVINLMGEIDTPYLENPFKKADAILEKEKGNFDFAIIDFHAEYTSEKALFSWYMDGKVNAVLGTHTHIPTADAKILPKGTAFITDVGMVGKKWGSLGVDFEPLFIRYLSGLPAKHEITDQGPLIFNAVLLNLGKENSIKLLQKEID